MQSRQVKPGLRVLVTAGAAGIGRAIADAFVEDGARVHVCDINEAALAECRATLGVTTSLTDVSREDQVKRLVDDAAGALGGLDVLINNAGIAGPTGTVDEIATRAWRDTIDINLNGQFYCAHYAVPLLRAAGEAAIINMSSAAGRFGYAFRTPYSASKWAIVGFTQSLAKELGPAGIRVNAILPGIVKGPRMEGRRDPRAGRAGGCALRGDGGGVFGAHFAAPYGDDGRYRLRRDLPLLQGRLEHLGSIDQRLRQRRVPMMGANPKESKNG
jgi:NAD(P)-dependent dehydrogenase (short-subunit alcohol dehydrogenase family)